MNVDVGIEDILLLMAVSMLHADLFLEVAGSLVLLRLLHSGLCIQPVNREFGGVRVSRLLVDIARIDTTEVGRHELLRLSLWWHQADNLVVFFCFWLELSKNFVVAVARVEIKEVLGAELVILLASFIQARIVHLLDVVEGQLGW